MRALIALTDDHQLEVGDVASGLGHFLDHQIEALDRHEATNRHDERRRRAPRARHVLGTDAWRRHRHLIRRQVESLDYLVAR